MSGGAKSAVFDVPQSSIASNSKPFSSASDAQPVFGDPAPAEGRCLDTLQTEALATRSWLPKDVEPPAKLGVIEQTEGAADVVIRAAVEVRGSDVVVDLGGSSGQVDWGGNVVFNFTYAYVHMAVKSIFDPQLPNNEGAAAPIRLLAPEGSVVNCTFPAAVAARMQVGHFMTEMVFKALSTATPDNIIAGSGGTPAQTNIFYGKRHSGAPWLTMIIRGGGLGASSRMDGHQCAIFPANGANTPVEIFESDTPLIVEERSLMRDSGGPGKMRGGLGRKFVIRVPDDEFAPEPPTSIAIQAGRFRYPPQGLFYGGAANKAKFIVNDQPGDPSGLTICESGDVIQFQSAGGGGYGDPLKRDPLAVEQDVLNEYVSVKKAREDYGVVMDPATLKVDPVETDKIRGSRKEKQVER